MPGRDTDSQFALWLAFSALPDRAALAAAFGENAMQCLLTEAEEILAGQVLLFGAEPRPLQLVVPGSLRHWTEYELGNKGAMQWKESDIKFIWQPGRFGWAFTLSRAYHSSGDERFAEAFWRYTETFLDANPPNVGPHCFGAGSGFAFDCLGLCRSSLRHFTAQYPRTAEKLGESHCFPCNAHPAYLSVFPIPK